ncbi:DNA/RNA non-specific endonuclease [Secundilactobacillus paracollinoides]|uniref:DNA/RNA non-specific endonuclease n=1 Tax=Secundilactobacillus paracollinoides TaxID=240427 RepID=UPI0006D27657|nr:DNA/RNA non-specific endonuclease [Secundilactobacillus paracollinoides]
MPKRYRRRNNSFFTYLVLFVAVIIGIAATTGDSSSSKTAASQSTITGQVSSIIKSFTAGSNSTGSGGLDTSTSTGTGTTKAKGTTELANLTYTDQQIVQVNKNVPTFTQAQLSTSKGAWQEYHQLDSLNRVTGADALLNKSLMPTAEREPLYVDPTGFHNKRITYDGKTDWLYNRSHLIGYQLTGKNNNLKNLMTGTRSLNAPDMEQYEDEVASYLKEHPHNYLRYQVTPIFRGKELVARGVHMQGESIGDHQVRFNIYIFNIQPGATIDYSTGYSTVSNSK